MNKYQDVNDCRPQVIEHFVGQAQLVERVNIALEAAWNQGTKLPHILMQGAAGVGKTQLARILSREMGMNGGLHEQLAQNMMKPTDRLAIVKSFLQKR